MDLTIDCNKRAPGAKPNQIRRDGLLPAVLYGHNGTESISLTVNAHDMDAVIRHATVKKTVINVNVPDLEWSGKAVLQEVHTHPWKKQVYHVSFFAQA